MLRAIQDGLWIAPVPYRLYGLPIGRQLVVARLPGGGLWIHSPIPVTAELRAELAALGPVRHVVAPSGLHDECLDTFQAEYPDATYHATPGLAQHLPKVRFDATLSDTPYPEWADVFAQHLIQGMPRINEVVFLHRSSRSLLIADIALNFAPPGPWWFAAIMRLNGLWGKFKPSRLGGSFMQDKLAVRRSIDHILKWDFDRIIVGHGRNIETGGREAFRQAFAFLP
ncbi:MAG TPA: DUF4336 domain-containing protein [Candidatus Didemnitutus sp.]|nr:DUF4336 domain-containing protein [Candidatus Didemnitutus sp.]